MEELNNAYRLYVHKDYQYQGIATAICDKLEYNFDVYKVTTHASITAKPFFEKRGYKTIKKQTIDRSGVLLLNYVMEKNKKTKNKSEQVILSTFN